jgi:hypothetical protein
MSFSSEARDEVKNKYFTFKNRHSKITENREMIGEKEFLMALFIRSGSVSDPDKLYHLDFVCDSSEEAEEALKAIGSFGIAAKKMQRKGRPVVYLKDSEAITDMLALLGAHSALLHYENVRVERELRGTVQRRVNFETANINKTVSASLKQVEDIELIRDRIGFADLPEQLREIALLRLDYPEATLQELSEKIPEVGRSGINHRFRKIAKIADELRTNSSV